MTKILILMCLAALLAAGCSAVSASITIKNPAAVAASLTVTGPATQETVASAAGSVDLLTSAVEVWALVKDHVFSKDEPTE